MIIEYCLIFLGVLTVSSLLSLVTMQLERKSSFWKHFLRSCFFIGIIVHEVSHYIMSFLTHTKVIKTNIMPTVGEQGELSGSISVGETNFFQALLVSLAPLFVGSYIIGFILIYIFSPAVNYTIAIILIYIAISILFMLIPSSEDIQMIGRALHTTSKRYSMIQLIIISVAITISYYVIILYEIAMFDLMMTLFFLTLFFYYGIKYFGLGLNFMFYKIRISRRKTKDVKYKTGVKHRKKNRGREFSPRTQW